MGYLRIKALFQCFILLCSLFTLSFLAPVVEARDDACCEKTLSGDSCIYTAARDCDTAYNTAYTTCEQTTFCQSVCCIDPLNGACYRQVGASTCAQRGGTVIANSPNCEVQQCQQGCCQIGNQCSLETESSCQLMTARYPTLQGQDTFDETVTNEFTCINQCRSGEEGCCVQGETCTYTPRGQCGGEFNNGRYCSDSSLACGTRAQDHKGCVEGSDDVYWFDNTNNRESLAEDCDYTQGTKCGLVNNNYVCKSLDCPDTQDFSTNVHDPQMGGFRYNGDSWCVYESGVGDYRDRVGSEHYRHLCINGEEQVETGRSFREQICIQGKVTVNGREHTNAQLINNEIYDSLIVENLSTVQRGFSFWETSDDRTVPKREGSDLCAEANVKCPVVWLKRNNFDDWNCHANCVCETQEFLDEAARYCKSKGDCGANLNVLGKRSDAGFQVAWTGEIRGSTPTQVSEETWINWTQYGVFGGMVYLQDAFELALSSTFNGLSSSTQLAALGIAYVGVFIASYLALGEGATILGGLQGTIGTVGSVAGMVVGALLLAYGIEHGDLAMTGAGAITLLGAALALIWIPIIGWIAAAVAVAWTFIAGSAEVDTKTLEISCEPWVAPVGGTDCEKCDDELPWKECTEYRCHSLGAACTYLAEDQSCATSNPNDVNSPQISPWQEALPPGLTLTTTPDGYYITPQVPYFTPLTFGIVTDELSQCKISTQHTANFGAMTQFFGSSSYKTKHNITLSVPPGQTYTYYVRCQDVNENPRSDSASREYFIQFSVDQQPDSTPPQILSKSLANNAFIPVGTSETSLTLYLNEPSQCRWNTQDQNYGDMPEAHDFLCEEEVSQDPLHVREYMCGTQLTGLQDNVENHFYFRCKDLLNNEQQQSDHFILRGTQPLQITSLSPQGDVLTTTPILQVTTTGGAEQGKASCTYQIDTLQPVPFFTTGNTQHTQSLGPLSQAPYTYTVKCTDAAGNTAEQSTTFTVTTDTRGPSITQIYTEGSTLHVLTNEPSTCSYSTTSSTFSRTEGTLLEGQNTRDHTLVVNQIHYYVLCWDDQENVVGPITIIT
ncbi:hypothetical protein J4208_02900 [Candidatus Woesearchaeota archaeon]|nr:hypothetical protein [Candidatus Woesearchaeota archaeon]